MSRGFDFEIEDELTVVYRYHYGGITPFFESLAAKNSPPFRITACPSCGAKYCPPRSQCSRCWQDAEWVDHDGSGAVESLVWAYWMPIDSPARAYTDLPYAYAAIRLDGCANLFRTRVVGVRKDLQLGECVGLRGRLQVIDQPSGHVGDTYFQVEAR